MKKLKCDDGTIRRFEPAILIEFLGRYQEVYCVECDEEFGVHDWDIVKSRLKAHICKLKSS